MLFEITPILLDQTQASQSTARNYAQNGAGAADSDFAATLQGVQAAQAAQTSSSDSQTKDVSIASSSRVDRSASDVSYEDDDFSGSDFLDIINPLQHIPVISALYRNMTGEEIKPAARLIGDMVYGGIIGTPLLSGALSVASLALEQQTGEEPTMMVANALFGSDESTAQADAANAQPAVTKLADAGTNASAQNASASTSLASSLAPSSKTIATAPLAAPSASMAMASASTSAGGATDSAGAITFNAASGKQAFGGALDPALTAGGHQVAANAKGFVSNAKGIAPTQDSMEKLGHTTISKSPLSRTARFETKQQKAAMAAAGVSANAAPTTTATTSTETATAPEIAALQQAAKTNSAAQITQAQNAVFAATAKGGLGGTSSTLAALPQDQSSDETKKLGSLVQKSVDAKATGSTLPPALVQDMMLMALDKYKTAGNYAPSEMSLP